jgi:hypothetical protein
MQNELLL